MPCFTACIKKDDFESKLVQLVEKTVVKVLEEKFPRKEELEVDIK